MSTKQDKPEVSSDEYFSYSDPYRTKDLIWDAYFGFVEHYNKYRMYKSMNRGNKIAKQGMIRYGEGFYGEIVDFLDKIYPAEKSKDKIKRLHDLFSKLVIKLEEEDIIFLRRFFGKFMIDSGMKNVIYLKDTTKPGKAFMNERYPDVEQSKQQ